MLQNPQIFCNIREHQNQLISAICTRKECDSQSTICSRCIFAFHKFCKNQTTFLEDLPKLISKRENEINLINQILDALIQRLVKLKNQYQIQIKSIREFREIPNMTYLNNIGQMLRTTNINLDQVLTGNELIFQLIETYLNPAKSTILTEQKKNEASELRNIGDVHYNCNEFEKALEYYDRALSINPSKDIYWNDRGLALYSLDKYQDALQCFDQALKINPNNDNSWNHKGILFKSQLGLTLDKLCKYQEAIQCFDNSININPTALKYHNKSFPLAKLNKLKEAEACLIKAFELDQDDSDITKRLIAIQDRLRK